MRPAFFASQSAVSAAWSIVEMMPVGRTEAILAKGASRKAGGDGRDGDGEPLGLLQAGPHETKLPVEVEAHGPRANII